MGKGRKEDFKYFFRLSLKKESNGNGHKRKVSSLVLNYFFPQFPKEMSFKGMQSYVVLSQARVLDVVFIIGNRTREREKERDLSFCHALYKVYKMLVGKYQFRWRAFTGSGKEKVSCLLPRRPFIQHLFSSSCFPFEADLREKGETQGKF